MELLWLGAAATLFVLLHVAIAAYLYRAASPDGGEAGSEYLPADDVEPQPAGSTDERIPCPTCGTPNDPSYRFCRRCIADLSSSVTAGGAPDGGKRLGS